MFGQCISCIILSVSLEVIWHETASRDSSAVPLSTTLINAYVCSLQGLHMTTAYTLFSDCTKASLSYRCIRWTCKHIDSFLSFPALAFFWLSVVVIPIWTSVSHVGKQFMLNSWEYLNKEFVSHILTATTKTSNYKTLEYLPMFYQVIKGTRLLGLHTKTELAVVPFSSYEVKGTKAFAWN